MNKISRIEVLLRKISRRMIPLLLGFIWLTSAGDPRSIDAIGECEESLETSIRIDPGHPWRPPYGLDRIGHPVTVVVEIFSDHRPVREYTLAAFRDGEEIGRQALHLARLHPFFDQDPSDKSSYTARETFDQFPTELVLFAACRFQGKPAEIARKALTPPAFEADAEAEPDRLIHPVDLGTIFVPEDWLILAAGQKAKVEVAAISSDRDLPGAKVEAWFESAPRGKVTAAIPLTKYRRGQASVLLSSGPSAEERDVLHVALADAAGKQIWEKKIQTMVVRKPPRWPAFGATKTKLRYDAPISLRHIDTGELGTMEYDGAWPAELDDVVVSLPNGSRFVFWRGSSYVPFWAGRYNTALCYEWAETSPPPEGFADSVEPLMDKELRYGRVEIVSSTAARVHVRWTYQSTDFNYKVFGDAPVEDYYFYPDGFGIRALTLRRLPSTEYELSEFIILAPQAAFPLRVLPSKLIDVLSLDGKKSEMSFPFPGPRRDDWKIALSQTMKVGKMPVVYRVRLHKKDPETAIYFNPLDENLPPVIFAPFYDRGYLVTPAYWGSHWPLARGKTTGWTIDDRIHHSPSHNSLMSWGLTSRPKPIRSATLETLDTLGRTKTMITEQWAWMIGLTEISDQRLLERARSFTRPPSLEVKGAHFDVESYSPERRAIRLVVEKKTVAITFRPSVPSVNPVFELLRAPSEISRVTLAGRVLAGGEYAWDGKVFWLKADIDKPTLLEISFGAASR